MEQFLDLAEKRILSAKRKAKAKGRRKAQIIREKQYRDYHVEQHPLDLDDGVYDPYDD